MTSRLENISQQRRAKLDRLRQQGIDPYPHRYHRSYTTSEAVALFEAEAGAGLKTSPSVSVAGRITAQRDMGKATFMDIRDGSGKLQVYFRQDVLGEQGYGLLKEFDIGDIIGVRGNLFRTKRGEVTVEARDFTMLAKALQPLPEKWHGLADVEKRYRQRYLDLISNEGARQVFQVRSQVITAVRRFLEARGFVEVETPVLQPSAGGAAARPFITHHQALDEDLYLRIALELHLKRLVVGGMDKVYELGRIFRNEGLSTKHNPEFTMLESYEAYADYNDVMAMLEEMVATVAREVLGSTRISYAGNVIELSPPWQRITLREAIRQGCGLDFEEHPDAESLRARMQGMGLEVDPGLGRGKLIDELISSLVEPRLMQPTFVLDYPVELSPLAKRKPDNPRLVERFEAFAGGMEIANAFSELNDPVEQRQRLEEQMAQRSAEEPAELDEDFVLALEHGMPPTGGLGVGIDRLVMLLTDQPSIREVILFPQLKSKP